MEVVHVANQRIAVHIWLSLSWTKSSIFCSPRLINNRLSAILCDPLRSAKHHQYGTTRHITAWHIHVTLGTRHCFARLASVISIALAFMGSLPSIPSPIYLPTSLSNYRSTDYSKESSARCPTIIWHIALDGVWSLVLSVVFVHIVVYSYCKIP